MKKLFFLLLIAIVSCDKKSEIEQTAEVSCGQCQFDLEGDGCNLAVRIDEKAYYVEGFGIDDFGDAHDEKTGFCEVIRKGKIEGKVENGKFIASKIELEE